MKSWSTHDKLMKSSDKNPGKYSLISNGTEPNANVSRVWLSAFFADSQKIKTRIYLFIWWTSVLHFPLKDTNLAPDCSLLLVNFEKCHRKPTGIYFHRDPPFNDYSEKRILRSKKKSQQTKSKKVTVCRSCFPRFFFLVSFFVSFFLGFLPWQMRLTKWVAFERRR